MHRRWSTENRSRTYCPTPHKLSNSHGRTAPVLVLVRRVEVWCVVGRWNQVDLRKRARDDQSDHRLCSFKIINYSDDLLVVDVVLRSDLRFFLVWQMECQRNAAQENGILDVGQGGAPLRAQGALGVLYFPLGDGSLPLDRMRISAVSLSIP